jgi:hypothetical protein
MSLVQALTLRSPEHAALAVSLGYGTLAIQAMQKFPSSAPTQKQACLMIRNLVVRNPENRYVFSSILLYSQYLLQLVFTPSMLA